VVPRKGHVNLGGGRERRAIHTSNILLADAAVGHLLAYSLGVFGGASHEQQATNGFVQAMNRIQLAKFRPSSSEQRGDRVLTEATSGVDRHRRRFENGAHAAGGGDDLNGLVKSGRLMAVNHMANSLASEERRRSRAGRGAAFNPDTAKAGGSTVVGAGFAGKEASEGLLGGETGPRGLRMGGKIKRVGSHPSQARVHEVLRWRWRVHEEILFVL
jgi:hypothetical protein